MSFHDLETYSTVPINNGTWAYAEKAEVLLWAYAMEQGPISVWDVASGAPMPADLADMLADPDVRTCWHNGGMFDSVVLKLAMGVDIPLPRLHDTLVQALAHSLPGSLGALCEVLRIDTDKAKDKAGKQLISLFCKPIPFRFRKRADGEPKKEYDQAKAAAAEQWPGRATAATHPREWQQFIEYARLDIAAMREVYYKMPKWNLTPTEVNLWHIDQIINRRGMCMDVALAECAVNAVDEEQAVLRERTVAMTNGEVESATKRDALLLHILAQYGVDLPDLQKATLERRVADPELPEGLRELLRIRLASSTTSTSKYKTLIRSVSSDGRLRGTKQFCGAGRTGRWAGRLFQPDNLPRPNMKQDQIDMGIEALMAGAAPLLFDDVMRLTSNVIRGCIIAPPGKKLVVADLSNIEGRVLAWLAGERWKLKAFYAFDAGTGTDLYKLSYAKSFGVRPEDVSKDQRQVGKVQELALGYEGGVGAFVTFAAAYNIDLAALAETAQRAIPGEVWGRANIMLEWHRSKGRDPAHMLGMADKTWLVCESFKIGWRDAHPNVVALWRDLDASVRAAIAGPGRTIECGPLKVRRDGAWLRIVLPSGRAICYPSPALVPEKKARKLQEWEAGEEVLEDEPTGRTVITYMGINQYSRKWERLSTYGGKLVENVTQAVARDVMAANMPAVEDAMYEMVLSVHDELLTEAPDHENWNCEHLAAIMATVPEWAPGLPLAAAGFEAFRYRKD
jgi:DNA polymerase